MKKPGFIHVIRRELLRIASSRVLLFSTLIAPVSVFLLLSYLFSAGVVRRVPIALVDVDQSATSRKIARMVEASPAAEIAFRCTDLYEAKTLMESGKIQAILQLPDHLERNLLKGHQINAALYLNNTNLVLGGNLQSGLYKALATVSAGIELQVRQKKGATEFRARQQVMPVQLKPHLMFNPYGNYAYFLALGLLPVLLTVFTFLGSLYALGIELRDGTAGDWMEAAGNNAFAALFGKFLPYFFLFFTNAMAMNLILFKLQGTPLNGSPGLILLSEAVLVLCYQSMAVLLLAVTANLRLSLSLGSAYTMMALTFAGLTFPTLAMPRIAVWFGQLFPYTSWLKIFMAQSLRGEPIPASLPYLLILLAFMISGLLALPLMKQKLTHPAFWGKA